MPPSCVEQNRSYKKKKTALSDEVHSGDIVKAYTSKQGTGGVSQMLADPEAGWFLVIVLKNLRLMLS